jgi:hypothetical protein
MAAGGVIAIIVLVAIVYLLSRLVYVRMHG